MQIRTHKYAEQAYPLVAAIQGDAVEAKYRTLALTFPSMVMQSGLAQAVGFLMAKSKKNLEHQLLLEHIAKLLNFVDNQKGDFDALHKNILKSNVTEYQLLSRKAIEASAWLKRYTQALLVKQS